jgi:signal transduction histidine kinase/CHASE3 domain sensor protein
MGSLCILIFIASISYRHSNALTHSTELMVRSYKVYAELELLISYVKDAETGQRGFIITNDSTFLQPYHGSMERVTRSYHILKELTVDNPAQQRKLDSLYHLINIRYNLFQHSLDLKSAIPFSAKELNQSLINGKNAMDIIRDEVDEMIDLEVDYLEKQQEKYQYEITFTPIFTFGLLMFSLTVFIFSYFKINRDLLVLKKANEKMIIATESILHAEEIGDFSSWQWNPDTNKFIYSDNQYRLLGCEPQSFEPNITKFLEFVHPDDKHIIISEGVQATNVGKPSIIFFRIIRKDGNVRYFKSISKLLINEEGKGTVIGVNSDITEQRLISFALEERNRELELSNKELASFNHVASHDLQEPLRKIQTFISRIAEKEATVMSDAGKEYFSRIQVSVQRMRTLIDDLLLFSRTNRSEKIIEKTDLNILLENAKQELGQAIEEKKAIIRSEKLPVLQAIPFQIQQLFNNLIGNSLKYSKPEIPSVIDITCETVSATVLGKVDDSKKYYKISFTDNGVGFKQQYAESIFVLFHRLPHESNYPGTGIGLAICKKIVENHSGFMEAIGKENIGATFIVFLPA